MALRLSASVRQVIRPREGGLRVVRNPGPRNRLKRLGTLLTRRQLGGFRGGFNGILVRPTAEDPIGPAAPSVVAPAIRRQIEGRLGILGRERGANLTDQLVAQLARGQLLHPIGRGLGILTCPAHDERAHGGLALHLVGNGLDISQRALQIRLRPARNQHLAQSLPDIPGRVLVDECQQLRKIGDVNGIQ